MTSKRRRGDRRQGGADVGAGAAIVDDGPVVELGRAAIDQPPAIVEAGAVDEGVIVAGGGRRDLEIAAIGVAVSQVVDDVDLAERAGRRHLIVEETAEFP
jgi:hypothetical protein